MSKQRKTKKRMNMKIIVFGLVALSLIIGSVAFFAPTQGAGPTYFRFTIPKNPDGTPIAYSPGWFGNSDKCPQNVTVVAYNDVEGYGIAYTTDKFVPKEVTGISQSTADSTTASLRDIKGVYTGQKLADRWLPEIVVKDVDCVQKDDKSIALKYAADSINPDIQSKAVQDAKVAQPIDDVAGKVIQQKAVYCPICGVFIGWYTPGETDSRQILICKNGHKSVTATYQTLDAKVNEQTKEIK